MGPESLRRNGGTSKESRSDEVARRSLLELPPSLAERIRAVSPPIKDATLARFVAETSRAYTRERSRIEDAASEEARLARLRFFLPRDLPKAMAVFRDLDLRGRLPRRESLRVLDLGAGLGTTTLSLARYAHLSGAARALDVTAVDLDGAALATMAKLVRNLEGFAAIELTAAQRDLRRTAAEARGPFDVIAIGLALNELEGELDERATVLASLVGLLAEDGVLVAIEPALRETTRALMHLRDVVHERSLAHIEGPCVGPSRCPLLENQRDWCHAEIPGALAPELATIARLAGLRADDPTFAWLALSRPERAREDVARRRLRLVSAAIGSKGKSETHACGVAGLVRLVELDRDARRRQVPLSSLRRGAVVELERTLEKSGFERVGAEADLGVVVD